MSGMRRKFAKMLKIWRTAGIGGVVGKIRSNLWVAREEIRYRRWVAAGGRLGASQGAEQQRLISGFSRQPLISG